MRDRACFIMPVLSKVCDIGEVVIHVHSAPDPDRPSFTPGEAQAETSHVAPLAGDQDTHRPHRRLRDRSNRAGRERRALGRHAKSIDNRDQQSCSEDRRVRFLSSRPCEHQANLHTPYLRYLRESLCIADITGDQVGYAFRRR